jgi:hypothetical protein
METRSTNGLKGQQANSPGRCPGYQGTFVKNAPQGQKQINPNCDAFALSGRKYHQSSITQGNALGWMEVGLSGCL